MRPAAAGTTRAVGTPQRSLSCRGLHETTPTTTAGIDANQLRNALHRVCIGSTRKAQDRTATTPIAGCRSAGPVSLPSAPLRSLLVCGWVSRSTTPAWGATGAQCNRSTTPWQCLNFLPEPQGHGSLRRPCPDGALTTDAEPRARCQRRPACGVARARMRASCEPNRPGRSPGPCVRPATAASSRDRPSLPQSRTAGSSTATPACRRAPGANRRDRAATSAGNRLTGNHVAD
jgi:hypothetical protein